MEVHGITHHFVLACEGAKTPDNFFRPPDSLDNAPKKLGDFRQDRLVFELFLQLQDFFALGLARIPAE